MVVRLRLITVLAFSVMMPAQEPESPLEKRPMKFRKFDSLEVVTFFTAIEIRRGDHRWRIALRELPIHANDCEGRPDRERCRALPKAATCTACIVFPEVIAWDRRRQRLYFSVATGTAKNRPWVIFRYDLRTRRTTRIVSDYGAGYTIGAVSRSGQFLAYVGYASSGVCGTRVSLESSICGRDCPAQMANARSRTKSY